VQPRKANNAPAVECGLRHIGLEMAFAAVLRSDGDFVAHDRGNLVVSQLQWVNDALLENDLAPGAHGVVCRS